MRAHIVAVSVAIAVAMTTLFGASALAHERRTVGPYQFVVGWLTEPAFQGQPNAASVRITDTRVTPAKAVEGLQETLIIEIAAGGLPPYRGEVRPVFGQPGLYALDVIPTAAGSYSFRIFGKVETLDVNEVFESGPGRFDDVEAQSSLQYPTKAPVADELATRLASIERDLGTTRAFALVALALAIVLPLGALWRMRSRR